jgi:sulfite dehydrogenase (cytochrome) subunit B
MTRTTLALTAALALATGAALAAPKSYAVPEPTAELRAPKAGTA